MILVVLGTQDKQFTRLLEAVDREIEKGVIKEKVVVQAGQNDERMTAFIETNNYKTEWREASGNGTIIYSRAN